ncbi:MAG: hypothetical protein LBV51_04720 [Acholeplasmatales bacterium]|jgi:hypothetical protein|nr:hypothetical protein [Acholeplasmatales bacterium]
MKYEEFKKMLDEKMKVGSDLYIDLLSTIINNPSRYTGLYRLTNVNEKIAQNISQSNEIKFGDFMEDIVTEYLIENGFQTYHKKIVDNEKNKILSVDQLFAGNENIYIVEQKMRDDHDSTKKSRTIYKFY